MKSFAKIIKDALMRYFIKKEIFYATPAEKSGLINILPRQISVSKDPIDLEKEFFGFELNHPKKERKFKIYIWDMEIGLREIKLIVNKNEGKLIDLIFRIINQPVYLSSIVVAEKKHWVKDDEQFVQEEVIIYFLNTKQRKEIFGHFAWINHINT